MVGRATPGTSAVADGGGRALAIASVVYVAAGAVLSLPRVGPFDELAWNWQNKVLWLLALTVTVAVWRQLTWRQVGVRIPDPGWWRPVMGVVVGAVVVQAVTGPMGQLDPTAETLAYQALIPGLDEELLFRGVLLVLLDRALVGRRAMWGGHVGWGVPITTLLFGLVHGLALEPGFGVSVDPASIVATGFIGAILVWVRVRTDSLLPAILLHNAINSSVVVATMLSA